MPRRRQPTRYHAALGCLGGAGVLRGEQRRRREPWHLRSSLEDDTEGHERRDTRVDREHPGTYAERSLVLGVSGLPNNPITFQPYGFSGDPHCGGFSGVECGGEKVVLDYSSFGQVEDAYERPVLVVDGKSHVRIQGLTFQGFRCWGPTQYGWRIYNGAHHIELRHNKMLDMRSNGTLFMTNPMHAFLAIRVSGETTHDITFFGNEIGSTSTVWSETLTCSLGAHHCLIDSNYIHDTDAIAIDIHGGANNAVVRNNRIDWSGKDRVTGEWLQSGTPHNVIYVDGGNSVVIERNEVTNSGIAAAVMAEPVMIEEGHLAHDVTIRNNLFWKNYAGVTLGTWYSDSDGSSVFNLDVHGNTLYSNHDGIQIRPFLTDSVSIRNNAVVNNENGYNNSLDWPLTGVDYNLWHGNGGPTDLGSNIVCNRSRPACR